jgi:hypothetical protein
MSVRLRPAYNKTVRIIGVCKSKRARLYRARECFAVNLPSIPTTSSCFPLTNHDVFVKLVAESLRKERGRRKQTESQKRSVVELQVRCKRRSLGKWFRFLIGNATHTRRRRTSSKRLPRASDGLPYTSGPAVIPYTSWNSHRSIRSISSTS